MTRDVWHAIQPLASIYAEIERISGRLDKAESFISKEARASEVAMNLK